MDEYQDIGPEQYELISAIAGRTLSEDDERLTIFAVGDDDQNIYAFNGSSTEFIRRFSNDYQARPFHLTENYRSTTHIIRTANAVIAPAMDRMKTEHPIPHQPEQGKGRTLADNGPPWTPSPKAAYRCYPLETPPCPKHRRSQPNCAASQNSTQNGTGQSVR